eukprot:NODE_3321_length_787_cov_83.726287_g2058_i1.p1 GENE.NODE_3321_length_787_cov_83.726287_g2058_i1~~NODE_3321_length_787_cov_83.726287_g2058_i1.p1  ORF type:complete len:136 (-),score=5.69 NODE_3321_length_787_cov_83.726287_g2058_i1:253-660(-)
MKLATALVLSHVKAMVMAYRTPRVTRLTRCTFSSPLVNPTTLPFLGATAVDPWTPSSNTNSPPAKSSPKSLRYTSVVYSNDPETQKTRARDTKNKEGGEEPTLKEGGTPYWRRSTWLCQQRGLKGHGRFRQIRSL